MKPDYKKMLAECPLPAALEVLGERWSFLILRGVFNGIHHFEDLQSTLNIARNILSNRLGRLVAQEILERKPDPADRRKVSYQLTEKGRALLPAVLAMRQWAERWISGTPGNPVLVDSKNYRPVALVQVYAEDGRPLDVHELKWVDRGEVLPA